MHKPKIVTKNIDVEGVGPTGDYEEEGPPETWEEYFHSAHHLDKYGVVLTPAKESESGECSVLVTVHTAPW